MKVFWWNVYLKKNWNTSQALDEFYKQLEILCGPEHLGILLRKPDKRKERYKIAMLNLWNTSLTIDDRIE